MTHLSVNLNKVAYLRNTRNIGIPSVLWAARVSLDSGASGITVHPRPDERHIRRSDVDELADLLKEYPSAEFNIEGNPFHNLMDIVREVRPHQCTLVPDDPNQATSDHGWNIDADRDRLIPILDELRTLGIRSSLFMDADPEEIEKVSQVGADRIELYTEPYAAAFTAGNASETWDRFKRSAETAQDLGLGVNAGHDLNLKNLGDFLEIPKILEVSIGHALFAEALEMGLKKTVREYVRICSAASPGSK
ncbi:MAG: pyridoxine 5'-phosphate synthase [Candidatus Omnitrophica bacterium]|nr:pyridoxine 5'-phosphate synthase [Candidatus Omnitrophota bacterium]